MNRRMFVSSLVIAGAMIPYGMDAEALARISLSARRIVTFRDGEWVDVANLSCLKVGEVFYGTARDTDEVLPIAEDSDCRYAKVTGVPYYIREIDCFGAEVSMFDTPQEALTC